MQPDSLRKRSTINLLIVEDSADDVDLCVRELRRAGFQLRYDVVQSAEALCAQVTSQTYDAVLVDYKLPSWNGFAVVELLRDLEKDIPVILITGTLSDDVAANLLSRGFLDYVHKDRLGRLSVAVQHAIELQRLRAELRHAQKLETLGRLAAGVAHDFNNILTVIQSQSGLLRSSPHLSPDMRESVQQVSRAAEWGSKLTGQLLAYSRRKGLQPRALDLNELLTRICNLLGRTLGEDIHFRFGLEPDLPAVYADSDSLEQVVTNVAIHARDSMPQGGQWVVSTSVVEIDDSYLQAQPDSRSGSFICLTMTDTGVGMDPETVSKLFESPLSNQALEGTRSPGLANVYGMVKEQQGWVEVQSRISQGTTFKIYLPQAEIDPSREPQADLSTHTGSETILVVEDEGPVRLTARTVLARYGYRVLEAANGVEALAIWHQHQNSIALLLTDMVMPTGLSGQELAEKFCSQKHDLKVVFTSGYSIEAAGKGLEHLEGLHFLQKPFDAHQLGETIRACLDS